MITLDEERIDLIIDGHLDNSILKNIDLSQSFISKEVLRIAFKLAIKDGQMFSLKTLKELHPYILMAFIKLDKITPFHISIKATHHYGAASDMLFDLALDNLYMLDILVSDWKTFFTKKSYLPSKEEMIADVCIKVFLKKYEQIDILNESKVILQGVELNHTNPLIDIIINYSDIDQYDRFIQKHIFNIGENGLSKRDDESTTLTGALEPIYKEYIFCKKLFVKIFNIEKYELLEQGCQYYKLSKIHDYLFSCYDWDVTDKMKDSFIQECKKQNIFITLKKDDYDESMINIWLHNSDLD
jgi:hypothetical protein